MIYLFKNRVDIMKTKIYEILKGLGTIALYFLLTIIGALLFGDLYFSSNKVIANLAQLGTYTLMLVVLSLVYYKRLIKDAKEFKKEYIPIALKNWIIGLGAMMICNIIVNNIVGDIAANETANRKILLEYPISNAITMVLVGPLIEEITFRASFKKAFDKWYTFSLFTGFLFGLAHTISAIIDGNLIEILFVIPYGALGFFLAKAFYKTDNIYTSFIAHMIHNGMCVALIILMGVL